MQKISLDEEGGGSPQLTPIMKQSLKTEDIQDLLEGFDEQKMADEQEIYYNKLLAIYDDIIEAR